MRRKRKPASTALEDRAIGLRAEREGLVTEQGNLQRERDDLEEARALARHLGRGDPDKIESRLAAVDHRLAELEVEIDGIARASAVIADEVMRAKAVEALDRVVEAKARKKKTARERERIRVAYDNAIEEDDAASAAVEEAEEVLDRAESDRATVKAVIAKGVADPLTKIERDRGEAAETARLRDEGLVKQAVEAFADGTPRAAVLARVPEHLLARVEGGMATWTPEKVEKRKWDRAIERARATGQGLIDGRTGEVLVEPVRE